jgi:polysaccharide pyruvyl transferase WcaK-like protein
MIYHIYANQSNIGDWLSAQGIQKLLNPESLVECFCDTPFVGDTIEKLSHATSKDLIVIGGGGLLMDYFIPFWTAFKTISEKIPFCVWGIGYCDLKMEETKPPAKLISEILVNSRLSIVRDEITRTYLKSLKLPAPVQCPSLNVINNISIESQDLLHVVNYSTVGPEAYNEMCFQGKLWAKKNNKVYRETNNLIQKGDIEQLNNILSLYRRSGYVLSSALHGCIISAAMGLKVITVSGDRKIEGFMNVIGLQEYVLEPNECSKIQQLLNVSINQKNPRDVIEEIRNSNKNIAEKILTIYKNL